jgi:hypothetical protein
VRERGGGIEGRLGEARELASYLRPSETNRHTHTDTKTNTAINIDASSLTRERQLEHRKQITHT